MITDMALLLIILTGLLVLRRRGGGAFGLTRVLWKQVRHSHNRRLNSLISFFFRKGIFWLVVAFAAEIPLLVSPTILLSLPLVTGLYPICILGVYCAKIGWYFSLTDLYMLSLTEFDSMRQILDRLQSVSLLSSRRETSVFSTFSIS